MITRGRRVRIGCVCLAPDAWVRLTTAGLLLSVRDRLTCAGLPLGARIRLTSAGLLLIGAVVAPLSAQELDGPQAWLDAFVAEHRITGLAAGWVSPRGDSVVTRGLACTGSDVPITVSTVFEIGSISKVFTGFVLAEMEFRGEARRDDPISRYLPESVKAPGFEGREITVGQLVTHTSGLPRLPDNLRPTDFRNPYADYSLEGLYGFVDSYAMARAPGASYEYSNLATGLLGALLAERAGLSQVKLFRTRALDPLGLRDTYLPESPVDPSVGDAATAGYVACGHALAAVAPYWDFNVLAGAGGLRSTPADLMRFVRIQLGHLDVPGMAVVRASHQVLEQPFPQLGVAYGWHVSPLAGEGSPNMIWHNGGTGGFRSFVGFVPELDAGVVLLVNNAIALQALDQLAVRLLRWAAGYEGRNGVER